MSTEEPTTNGITLAQILSKDGPQDAIDEQPMDDSPEAPEEEIAPVAKEGFCVECEGMLPYRKTISATYT